MKKLIPIISLVLGIIAASIVIFVYTKDRKRKIKIESFDKKVTIDLGKYKVKDYSSSTDDGINIHQTFIVNSGEEFLNFIKESPYYDSSLCFNYKNETFGYFIKDDRLFRYRVDNDWVELRSIGERILVENSNEFYISIMDVELGAVNLDGTIRYEWHGKLSFAQIKMIMEKLGANIEEIKEEEIIINVIYGVYRYRTYDGTKIRLYMDQDGYLIWEYVE